MQSKTEHVVDDAVVVVCIVVYIACHPILLCAVRLLFLICCSVLTLIDLEGGMRCTVLCLNEARIEDSNRKRYRTEHMLRLIEWNRLIEWWYDGMSCHMLWYDVICYGVKEQKE